MSDGKNIIFFSFGVFQTGPSTTVSISIILNWQTNRAFALIHQLKGVNTKTKDFTRSRSSQHKATTPLCFYLSFTSYSDLSALSTMTIFFLENCDHSPSLINGKMEFGRKTDFWLRLRGSISFNCSTAEQTELSLLGFLT